MINESTGGQNTVVSKALDITAAKSLYPTSTYFPCAPQICCFVSSLFNTSKKLEWPTEIFFVLSAPFSVIQHECGALTPSGNSVPGTCNPLYRCSRLSPVPLSDPPFASTVKSWSPPDPFHWSEKQKQTSQITQKWHQLEADTPPPVTTGKGLDYRHAQCSQRLLSHGHSHPLFLCSGLPAGCFDLEVYITVFPQCLQKVLSQGSYSFIAGYLLQLVQVGNGVGAYEHLWR